MRKSLVKAYVVKKRTVTKDSEGNRTVTYADPNTVTAMVYKATGKVLVEMYGERLNYMLNMKIDAKDKAKINEGDGVCVASSDVDYKVIFKPPLESNSQIVLLLERL